MINIWRSSFIILFSIRLLELYEGPGQLGQPLLIKKKLANTHVHFVHNIDQLKTCN